MVFISLILRSSFDVFCWYLVSIVLLMLAGLVFGGVGNGKVTQLEPHFGPRSTTSCLSEQGSGAFNSGDASLEMEHLYSPKDSGAGLTGSYLHHCNSIHCGSDRASFKLDECFGYLNFVIQIH